MSSPLLAAIVLHRTSMAQNPFWRSFRYKGVHTLRKFSACEIGEPVLLVGVHGPDAGCEEGCDPN